ncbi:MAG: thiamine diphosphokinase [Candidatus Kapabacteria bacterium]|jgi:thiamine pyrophosphokinase|nr:thiamine diphosphokinase [Candidatus Kapabacteria bacterium]
MNDKKYTTLSFGKLKFDAAICLNSDLPSLEEFAKLGDMPILAADGAAGRLRKIGVTPSVIIGDLDSLSSEDIAHFEKVKIISVPDQDTNDFEKTLKYAQSMNYHSVLILGIHGGEMEHTLNNWSVFARYSKSMNLALYDAGRYGISLDKSIHAEVKTGETISLIPQTKTIISTENLKWQLSEEILQLAVREGARNVAESDSITLEIHRGELLLFIDGRLPSAPSYD